MIQDIANAIENSPEDDDEVVRFLITVVFDMVKNQPTDKRILNSFAILSLTNEILENETAEEINRVMHHNKRKLLINRVK